MPRLTPFAVAMLLVASPFVRSSAQKPDQPTPVTTSGTIRPGTYDLELEAGGGVLKGTLVLATSGDSLTARLHVGDHEPAIRSLTRNGSHLTLNAGAEGMQVVYQLDFTGDTVKGAYLYNGNPGSLTGKRRTQP